jgi:PhnB protein
MQLHPYLSFNGQCEAAFKFYAQVLGGKIEAMIPHTDTPAEKNVPPEWRDKIMHARVNVNGTVLMWADAPPAHYRKPEGYSVMLHSNNVAEAERAFNALAENGNVRMPLQQTFWAARFGMLIDRFGVPWMINCEQGSSSNS